MHVEIQSVMRVQSFKKFFECLPLPFICFENIERELNNNGSNLIKKNFKNSFSIMAKKGWLMFFKRKLKGFVFVNTLPLSYVHLHTR